MAWVPVALGLAGSIFEGLASLFGGGGITKEELEEALDNAIDEIANRTFLIMAKLFEEQQLEQALDNIENLQMHLQDYQNTPTEGLLLLADQASVTAWNSVNNNVNLIDKAGVVGSGLLGHPWFLIAASLRFMVLEEWIRFYAEQGNEDLVEGARQNLRNALRAGIDTALEMEGEWIDWTSRRFSSLTMRRKVLSYDPYIMSYRWFYWFNNERIRAYRLVWQSGQGVEKIIQAGEAAQAALLDHYDREMQSVRDGFVNPSKSVRAEWTRALARAETREAERAYASIDDAMDAALHTYELLPESFRNLHPEERAYRAESVNGPSLIAKRR
jgi:hypothetical protein